MRIFKGNKKWLIFPLVLVSFLLLTLVTTNFKVFAQTTGSWTIEKDAADANKLKFYQGDKTKSPLILNQISGFVGINKAAPATALDINGSGRSTSGFVATGYNATGWSGAGAEVGMVNNTAYFTGYNRSAGYIPTYFRGGTVFLASNGGAAANIYLQNNGVTNLTVKSDGNVELAKQLRVLGTTTGFYLGKGSATDAWARLTKDGGSNYHGLAVGPFWANGATRFDLSEVTPVNETDKLEQGDIVIIDPSQGTRVTRSKRPYDSAVYGIVSSYEQASMVIGGEGGPESTPNKKDRTPVALIGRVKAKVSAENGSVKVGDLLTTSSTPGYAMRCADKTKCFGATVGKALEPLAGGKGTILVLATLQ